MTNPTQPGSEFVEPSGAYVRPAPHPVDTETVTTVNGGTTTTHLRSTGRTILPQREPSTESVELSDEQEVRPAAPTVDTETVVTVIGGTTITHHRAK